jgi:hypothetical protein
MDISRAFLNGGGIMRNLRLALLAISIFVLAANADAASLSYSPESSSVTVESGSVVTVPLTVSIVDADGTYYIWFVDTVEGNLPIEWISSSSTTTFLSSTWISDSTELTISVPADTPPGTYSGRVFSKGMKSHLYADPGTGMLIEVVVSSTSGCSGSPNIDIADVSPNIIWPPNHSMDVVTVSGTVTMPSGCSLISANYSIEDEYGTRSGTGEFTIGEGGEFSVPLPVEAWRKGQDKDGRHYTIQVFAENESGTASSVELEAIVPHDRGRCPDRTRRR